VVAAICRRRIGLMRPPLIVLFVRLEPSVEVLLLSAEYSFLQTQWGKICSALSCGTFADPGVCGLWERDLVLIEERHDLIIEQIGCRERCPAFGRDELAQVTRLLRRLHATA